MPILRLNAGPTGLTLNGSPGSVRSAIGSGLRSPAMGSGPVIILIHGCKYDPASPAFSPHSRIFAMQARRSSMTCWPGALGFGAGDPDEGLAIAFGWPARGHLWRALRSAHVAGLQLGRVINDLKAIAPQRPVHVVTHSMGSEVILSALHALPAGAVQRIVTLSAASYVSCAVNALQTPAGRVAELFNITSRENDLFDSLYERLIAPPEHGDGAMGRGLNLANAVNIELDCPQTLAALRMFGAQIAPARRRVCHWSSYTRPGALPFYARALRRPHSVPLPALRDALPLNPTPRWTRMLARPRFSFALPMTHKTAS